jgi:hypothetical protein
VHCLTALKGLYSDTICGLADDEAMRKYDSDRKDKDKKEDDISRVWKNTVKRSWNGILQLKDTSMATELLFSQMDVLDGIFKTHFETIGSKFMTGTDGWKEQWSDYIDAVLRYADNVAQQPEADATVLKIREQLAGKMRFVLTDHGSLYAVPVFPLVTRSVVPLMVKTIDEIENALLEVSYMCAYSMHSTL